MTVEASPRPLDAALDYAQRGYAVFPCHTIHGPGCSCRHLDCPSPAKHPRIARGLNAATTDPSVIDDWWRRWPTANIAIRTGSASGLVVVDVDPDHGGARSLEQFVAEHGTLPVGPTVRTGSGGLHLYFAHPGHKIRNSTATLAPGIDIRGDGGYIIAPPSQHVSGATYEWTRDGDALPDLPAWLHERIKEPERTATQAREHTAVPGATSAWARAALEDEARYVRNAVEGTRNHTLNRAAFRIGQIVGAGLLEAPIAESVLIDNGISAGLDEREARLTARSGLRAGVTQPRGPRVLPEPSAPAVPTTWLIPEVEIDLPERA